MAIALAAVIVAVAVVGGILYVRRARRDDRSVAAYRAAMDGLHHMTGESEVHADSGVSSHVRVVPGDGKALPEVSGHEPDGSGVPRSIPAASIPAASIPAAANPRALPPSKIAGAGGAKSPPVAWAVRADPAVAAAVGDVAPSRRVGPAEARWGVRRLIFVEGDAAARSVVPPHVRIVHEEPEPAAEPAGDLFEPSEAQPESAPQPARPSVEGRPLAFVDSGIADAGNGAPAAADARATGIATESVTVAGRGGLPGQRVVVSTGIAAAAVLMAAGVALGLHEFGSGSRRAAPPRSSSASHPAPQPARRVGSAPPTTVRPRPTVLLSNSTAYQATYMVSAGQVDVSVSTVTPCWVELRAGSATGPIIFEATLGSGDRRIFTHLAGAWLRFGNPPGVVVAVNGTSVSLPAREVPYNLILETPPSEATG
jgi:hypothetical protein